MPRHVVQPGDGCGLRLRVQRAMLRFSTQACPLTGETSRPNALTAYQPRSTGSSGGGLGMKVPSGCRVWSASRRLV